jgi:F-type H+-transporting ATPase subunit epsilon
VSVRNAVAGTDLTQLRDIVQQQFVHLNEQEQNLRSVLAKLESRFMRKFREFQS